MGLSSKPCIPDSPIMVLPMCIYSMLQGFMAEMRL